MVRTSKKPNFNASQRADCVLLISRDMGFFMSQQVVLAKIERNYLSFQLTPTRLLAKLGVLRFIGTSINRDGPTSNVS